MGTSLTFHLRESASSAVHYSRPALFSDSLVKEKRHAPGGSARALAPFAHGEGFWLLFLWFFDFFFVTVIAFSHIEFLVGASTRSVILAKLGGDFSECVGAGAEGNPKKVF